MRLVDADKQLESVDRMIPKDKTAQEVVFSVDSVRDQIIKDAPTIDAIPVEWILHIAETLENNGSKNRSGAIRAMVDLWNGEIG